LVISSHSVCDFGSVISVDFFSVISDFGRHRSSHGSRDDCRTAPDVCRPLDQADGLEP